MICQDLPVHQMIWKSGYALYLGGCRCRCGRRCHAGDSTDITLVFEDAQVIPPFTREETYLGHIWDILAIYLGHICDISWAYLGQILDIFWAYLGHIMGLSWAYI